VAAEVYIKVVVEVDQPAARVVEVMVRRQLVQVVPQQLIPAAVAAAGLVL
jgi:hypothetical protein